MPAQPYPTLVPYGWDGDWSARLAAAAGESRPAPVPGRVLRHDGVALLVALPDGIRTVALRHRVTPAPVVGDWVLVDGDDVRAVLPRRSLLSRRAAGAEAPQALAANVGRVLVTCGLDRPVTAGRIDRTIALSRDAGAVPVVVLTKADLVGDGAEDELGTIVDRIAAEHPGIEIVTTSTVTGEGVEALRTRIGTDTVVLIGESGAGKSSLTNALVGDEVAATGRVRAGDAKGRHTTTTRQAHVLPGGGVLIDTPGVREVGLWADPDAVDATFAEVDALATECRFADCAHDAEPGCAVTAAVDDGRLSAARLAAWRALAHEAEVAAERTASRARRRRGRPGPRIRR